MLGGGDIIAQKFSHRIGLSYMISWEKPYEFTVVYPNRPPIDVVTSKDPLRFVGLNYHLSRKLIDFEPKQMSISLGIPISISALFKASTDQGVSPDNYFYLSLPIQVELNVGAGSFPASATNFGGFVAVGYNYHLISTRELYYQGQKFEYQQFDPMATAGISFRINNRLSQLSYSHTFPTKKRENLGEIQGPYPFLPLPTEVSFERGQIIRGMDVVSFFIYLGKHYKN